jgi:NAD(P)H-dependent FMN reductase
MPHDKIGTAGGFLARETNRLTMSFVSIEKSQKPDMSRICGNTRQAIFVPVIVGAVGRNRIGEKVAQFIAQEIAERDGVETGIIELGEAASATLAQAEAIILVVPEYNYGFPDVLKKLLETSLPKQNSRIVGICDLSPGWFGGSRLLETLLPMMRKSGLIPLFWDENCCKGEGFFEASDAPIDQTQCKRLDNFLQDLLWMALSMRQRREKVLSN